MKYRLHRQIWPRGWGNARYYTECIIRGVTRGETKVRVKDSEVILLEIEAWYLQSPSIPSTKR
jgi:hypothetical protein